MTSEESLVDERSNKAVCIGGKPISCPHFQGGFGVYLFIFMGEKPLSCYKVIMELTFYDWKLELGILYCLEWMDRMDTLGTAL